jgi:tRNA modification GTPase
LSFFTDDTIVAIATPPGRGGIGVVRLSGPDAHRVASSLVVHRAPLVPRHATFTTILGAGRRSFEGASEASADRAQAIDQAIVTYYPAPHSYTGEDVVEISAHGSPAVLHAIVEAAMGKQARLAEPGEFTLRAFLNARIDLTQAEAIGDLIDAVTPLQARTAFDQLNGTLTEAIAAIDRSLFDLIARLEASVDFPEEGFHFVEPLEIAAAVHGIIGQTDALLHGARAGRMLREGLQVVILGAPNVGKSSLFNALVGAPRAIVTESPGTTRDLVSEIVDVHGLCVTLVDSAGLRDTTDPVESEGVARSKRAGEVADLVLFVVDGSRLEPPDRAEALRRTDEIGSTPARVITVVNKSDIGMSWTMDDAVHVSAVSGEGIGALRHAMASALDVDFARERPALTNIRHIALVEHARQALCRAREVAASDGPALAEEFLLADLQQARQALEEVTGRRSSDDLLHHIFSKFCVGK